MEEFWNVAQRAMDLAVETAETVSKKGKELAAGSAEEATRQFRIIQEQQNAFVGSAMKGREGSIAHRVAREDMQREMEEYGITDEYMESVKQLDYSSFRDFHESDESSIQNNGKQVDDTKLNRWQERHALLLVKNVKEIDELRFVLCPKYMDDGQFWDTYFKLMKEKLPTIAFTWEEGDVLPRPHCDAPKETTAPLDYFEDQFRDFSKKASSAVLRAGASAGVDMSKLLSAMDLSTQGSISGEKEQDKIETEVSDISKRQEALLDVDPDLEEYLGDLYENGDDDDTNVSDLDEYLNELTKSPRQGDEVDPEEEEEELNAEDLEALIQAVGDDD